MNCVIIDDEPLAIQIIEKYIEDVPFLNVKQTFNNGLDAMNLLHKDDVDLLFLDINMPKITGLELLMSLPNPPIVIITTAYREYAMDAYELDVVDYLKKPIAFPRFLKAVNKAQEKVLAKKVIPPTVNETQKDNEKKFIFIKTNKQSHKIDLDSIVFVESLSDYAKIHFEDKTLTIHSTLKNVENWLPENEFPRIHKSYIVSLSKIESIIGNRVKLNDKELPIGGTYRKYFLDLVGSYSQN